MVKIRAAAVVLAFLKMISLSS